MTAAAAIAAVGASVGGKFISPKMLNASTTMAASTKYSYLVYKIAFLQLNCLC